MTVVDASVWVSRFMAGDVHHSASRDWLREYLASGGIVVAPMLLLTEVSGAISRQTGQPGLAREAIRHMMRLKSIRFVPLDRWLGRMAAEIAADLGLRGADAVYVATARRLSIPLVTWDVEQQRKAASLIQVNEP
ncbi:MAG: type II toxin-antitoxin system VapC family toxin [Chloroflexota bacterium]